LASQAWYRDGSSNVDPAGDALLAKTTRGSFRAPAGSSDQVRRPHEPTGEEVERLQAQVAAIEAEVQQSRRFVELYRLAELRDERAASAKTATREPLLPPEVAAEVEIDRTAGITVLSADTHAKESNRVDEAMESYRSVVTSFPNSHWADIAQERLSQIKRMN
jgi:hypothetical protein